MDEWYPGPDQKPLNVYGRRRVGKSWLLRAFAHGKPAVILVAAKIAEGMQIARFAERLEPHVGVRPDLPDVASLMRTLYRLGRTRELLVVLDEFPYLLPAGQRQREETLTGIQAVWEEDRDEARGFFGDQRVPERIERFAVTGGMPLYLDELGRGGSLRDRVCKRVLDSRGPLFDDPARSSSRSCASRRSTSRSWRRWPRAA